MATRIQTSSLPELRDAAADCRACDLWRCGTQTVFGEGTRRAKVVLVGEQPGDREDLTGRPFVGPAGRLLDRALERAGIERRLAYVTNVVKHFKWTGHGKRRIHQRPNAEEIRACRPWLDAELAAVEPKVVVALGATAARALLGREFRLTKRRGIPIESELAPFVLATVHPSVVLRAPGNGSRQKAFDDLVGDLEVAARLLAK